MLKLLLNVATMSVALMPEGKQLKVANKPASSMLFTDVGNGLCRLQLWDIANIILVINLSEKSTRL